MIKMVLACGAGMSSSMLLERIKVAADKRGIEIVIDAIPHASIEDYIGFVDVVLLGPQLAHVQRTLTKRLGALGIGVGLISVKDYANMDGERLLDQAIEIKETHYDTI